MYGVPANLDLTFLHGAELIQVCLGSYQLQFQFHPTGSIYVEGDWELRDGKGEVIDRSHEEGERPPYQLHRLLSRRVTDTEVSAPKSIAIMFETGYILRLFDNSEQYESFQIQGFVI
jgi:hypothetical protein